MESCCLAQADGDADPVPGSCFVFSVGRTKAHQEHRLYQLGSICLVLHVIESLQDIASHDLGSNMM